MSNSNGMNEDARIAKSARRGRRRRRLSYAIAILASLIIAFLVYTKSRFLPNRVTRYVNQHYLEDSRFEFQCGRIGGDFVNRVIIRDAVLRYHAAEASFNVFRADEIDVDYRLLDVLKFNLVVEDLKMHNGSVQIRNGADGALVLPWPAAGTAVAPSGESGGSIDVRKFEIDGLQVLFGDGERELAVRDVNLAGSFGLDDGGAGQLEIDRGTAFLTNTETLVSSIRINVEHDAGEIRLNDFVARLDQSFIMATGGYRDGVLNRLQLVFNPISLDEMHSLGLIPDLSGEFAGNVVVEGPFDSLGVSGSLTGTGLGGLAISAMSFEGAARADEIAISHLDGQMFGSHVRGSFKYRLGSEQDFVFDGECFGVDLSEGFLAGQGLPATDFYGKIRLEHDAGLQSYAFDAEFDSATVAGYRTNETALRGMWTPAAGLVLDEWSMARPGYTATVSGDIPSATSSDLLFRLAGDDLGYFWDFVGVPRIEGEVSVSGRGVGALDDMRINLNGEVTGVRFLFAGIDSGRVQADVRGVGGPNPSASVDITGKHVDVGARTFASPHVRLDVHDGVTAVRDITFVRGDTTFTADLDVTAREDSSVSIVVNHAAVIHPTEAWRLTEPAHFRYASGELAVDSLVLSSASGRVGVSGSYSEPREAIDVTGWGDNVDLAIVADAAGLPIDLTGKGTVHAQARGAIEGPSVEVEMDLSHGRIDSRAFDHIGVSAAYRDGEYELRRLHVVDGGDSLDVVGSWRPDASPLAMARGDVNWDAALSSPFEAALVGHGYAITSLARALHQSIDLDGAIHGQIGFTGTPSVPEVEVSVSIEPRAGATFALPPTEINAAYADGALTISRMVLHDDVDAAISGRVPVRLSLVDGVEIPRAAPLELDIRIRQPEGVVELSQYWSLVNTWKGGFHGDVSVRGTIDEPRLGGSLAMDDAEIQVAGMVELLENVSARVTFVDNVVQLTSFTAESDGGGSLRAAGSVTLDGWKPSGYRGDVFLRDLWLRSIPNVESLQEGQLSVVSETWSDGRQIPNVTGALTVKEATLQGILEDSGGTPATITLPTDAPGWVCSIDLDAENNVWIRDPDYRIELGGTLILKRDDAGLYLRGDLNVLRGQYTVYGNKFRIVDGTLDFSTASLRPEIHINAYTPHRTEGGFERRIYLNLDWPRDKKEAELTLTYDEPGYYESDIWRMLGGSVAEGLAANTLERVLYEQMSDVSIDVEQRQTQRRTQQGTPEQEMTIGIGKYLWEDVYLRYRQGLTLTTSHEVEVEYRLSNMFLVRSELIRHSRRSYVGANGQTLDEFNLDITLRWEF
jgi:hypothetical protein